jgi:energy-coupling factor transport system ATP-binding protein
MIEIKELKFSYNKDTEAEIRALAGINAFIYKGEFVAIIGHNGCGKSTLAKHLNALLLPNQGKVVVDGMDTTDGDKLWDIRRICGMVFQNPDNQIVATVVEEDVAFGPENLGVSPEEIRKRVDSALESVGLSSKLNASSNLLSGGQKQRLAIAGIIAMHPDYIVFDEATSMLDPKGREEVLRTVRRINKEENITVIYITHSMDEAARADRVIVMEAGDIVMNGTPAEVFRNIDELKKLRLDVPVMAELAHRLREKGIDLPPGILTVDEMVDAIKISVKR